MPQRPGYPAIALMVLVAGLAAACLDSAGLSTWADGLPDCAASRGLSLAAHKLDDRMQRMGLNRPVQAVQAWVRDAEARRFAAETPPE